MNKWSVIMLSYLGEQTDSEEMIQLRGKRKYSKQKFINSVESYINQDYPNKELIIVSDGCQITNNLYYSCYSDRDDIKLIMMPKAPPPPPPNRYRQAAIVASTGSRICYLDPDDCLFPFHLKNLELAFSEEVDWIYFDRRPMAKEVINSDGTSRFEILGEIDLLEADPNLFTLTKMEYLKIGGSAIAHKRNLEVQWGRDLSTPGRGGDWRFIEALLEKYPKYSKAPDCYSGYIICQTAAKDYDNNISDIIARTPKHIVDKFDGSKR